MRRIIYGISLWVFIAAGACTIASIALPNWISYTSPTDHDPIRVSYGLHKRCSSITGQCTPFPQYEDCTADDRYFCSMWRSVGFLMNFSVVVGLACVVAYVTILVGGRGSREGGWKVLSGLLGIVAVVQMIAMALVVGLDGGLDCLVTTVLILSQAYLYDHDTRFFVGWQLDKSWILCTVSWTVLAVDALGVTGAAMFLPKEDDYEMIPEAR